MNYQYPFQKIVDNSDPQKTAVRLGVKTKLEFDDVNKFTLLDPKASKHFNQYKELNSGKATTRGKFGAENSVSDLLGQNDAWLQKQQ